MSNFKSTLNQVKSIDLKYVIKNILHIILN